MTREEVKDKVFEAFSEAITDPELKVTEESNIMDDLAMDSVEILNALCTLEDEFEIEISDSMLKRMIYIRDMIDILTQLQEN